MILLYFACADAVAGVSFAPRAHQVRRHLAVQLVRDPPDVVPAGTLGGALIEDLVLDELARAFQASEITSASPRSN